MSAGAGALRLDKFLWAARFFKTRGLASEAIEAGRVSVNGERAKPAKTVKPGDSLCIRRPPYEHLVTVRAASDKRGSASVAQALYEETAESRAKREAVAAEMKAMPPPVFKGRPTKKDRRTLERFVRRQDEDWAVVPANPLDALPLTIALRESDWLAPSIRVVHAIGFATLASTVIAFDLRVLGLSRRTSIRALSRRLMPWTFAAVAVIVPTGGLLFLSRSADLISSRLFMIKMALIGAAAINAVIFRTGPYQGVKAWDIGVAAPLAARLSVALSIALWISVIVCGRTLAAG